MGGTDQEEKRDSITVLGKTVRHPVITLLGLIVGAFSVGWAAHVALSSSSSQQPVSLSTQQVRLDVEELEKIQLTCPAASTPIAVDVVPDTEVGMDIKKGGDGGAGPGPWTLTLRNLGQSPVDVDVTLVCTP